MEVKVDDVSKKKRITILVSSILAVIIAATFGYYVSMQSQYSKNLIMAVGLMQDYSSKAEEMNDTYQELWHQAIFEPPAKVDGKETDDFNEALNLQQEIYKKNGDIREIRDGLQEVKEIMRDLSKPPIGYARSYELALELYGYFNRYASLAVYPSGTYDSYSAELDDLSKSISNKLLILDVSIP